MKIPRRRFLHLAAGAATLPTASRIARAQQQAVPVIGFLNSGSLDRYRSLLDAFLQGLNDGGYFEGRNVAIERRWAEGQPARLREMAADLVRRKVPLIAATGGSASAHAAKDATSEILVLFIGGPDPVADGLVRRLNRPDGNLTGAPSGRLSNFTASSIESIVPIAFAGVGDSQTVSRKTSS
jgi:putative ABC transport system substrate-binding protein